MVPLDLSLDTGAEFWIPVPLSLLNTAFLLPEPSTEFSLAPEAACLVVFPFNKGVIDAARAGATTGANDAGDATEARDAGDVAEAGDAAVENNEAGSTVLLLSRAAFTAADISGCREEIT